MVNLVDIASATERFTVRGQDVEVCGVSAAGVAQLLARFPDLRKLFSGRDVGMEELMAVGGDLVAAIIAAGTGTPGDEAAEAAAGRLRHRRAGRSALGDPQGDAPEGGRPFRREAAGARDLLDPGSAVSGPATTSRKRSSG